MRKYETVYTDADVNRLAREGYKLHSVVATPINMAFVMEWVEPHATATMPEFVYRDPTKIVTS